MKKKNIFIAIIFLTWLVAKPAQAVSLYLKTDNTLPTENLSILNIDTGNDNINTLEGKIIYDANLLDCDAKPSAKSIINLWLNQPVSKNGEITFAGIIPGGYLGQGEIISIVCQNKNDRAFPILNLKKENFQIYLNNGTGDLAEINITDNQTLSPSERQIIIDNKSNDQTPPEILTLEISKNTALSENNYLLIFNAADKQSGIASAAIATSKDQLDIDRDTKKITNTLPWLAIESPYILPNQALNQFIYLKITDQAGNIKLARLAPIKPGLAIDFLSLSFSLILIIFLAVTGLIMLKLKRKHKV